MKIGIEVENFKTRFAILPTIGISWEKYDCAVYFVFLFWNIRIGDKNEY